MDTAEISILTLSPDNPWNTTITSANGDELYSVVTERTEKAIFTTVRDVREEVIGSLEWREVLPDRVTVGAQRPISMAGWLKRSKVPFRECVISKFLSLHAGFIDCAFRQPRIFRRR